MRNFGRCSNAAKISPHSGIDFFLAFRKVLRQRRGERVALCWPRENNAAVVNGDHDETESSTRRISYVKPLKSCVKPQILREMFVWEFVMLRAEFLTLLQRCECHDGRSNFGINRIPAFYRILRFAIHSQDSEGFDGDEFWVVT